MLLGNGHTCAGAAQRLPSQAGMPDETPLIEVRDLVKRFGDKTVLDRLNLQISRGETLVIIGGSGSGKSTLARILVGLEEPSMGDVYLEGVPFSAMDREMKRESYARFAMVFQKFALLDSLPVFDNVAFPLRERTHLSNEEIRAMVMRALSELGVEDAASKLPGELSGGMAKRVAIARATVGDPEIIIYDEPTSGLDPISSRTVDALIERMRETHFVTSIVITHDMLTAYDVADRVVVLAGGRIVANGAPEVVFRSHASEVEPFALSSGLDITSLAPRKSRKPATEIQLGWERRHPSPRKPTQRCHLLHRLAVGSEAH
jgi:phospholipid/cholesterol/gamma-HCH transport system ATP-binding protein